MPDHDATIPFPGVAETVSRVSCLSPSSFQNDHEQSAYESLRSIGMCVGWNAECNAALPIRPS